jgi:hypothetical protein
MNPELAEQLVMHKDYADLFEEWMKQFPFLDPDDTARWVLIIKREIGYRNKLRKMIK